MAARKMNLLRKDIFAWWDENTKIPRPQPDDPDAKEWEDHLLWALFQREDFARGSP